MDGRKVYIGNLEKEATKEEVDELFAKFGAVESVWIARKPAGFAFVVYEAAESAQDAVQEMDGVEFKGQALKVEISKSDGKRKRRDDKGYNDRHHDEHRRRGDEVERYGSSRRDDYHDRRPRDDYERRPRYDDAYDRRRYEEERYESVRHRSRSTDRRGYYDRRY